MKLLFACLITLSAGFPVKHPAGSSSPVLRAATTGSEAAVVLGSKSTAEDVVNLYAPSGLEGKLAIVTGGNSGIGLETVRVLARAGCDVVLCSRSVAAGEAARASILSQEESRTESDGSKYGRISVQQLDLADLTNVEGAAAEISRFLGTRSAPKVDYLILNAGVMAIPTRETTVQGLERQIGVNHFGHFHLTSKLMDAVAQPGSRVVVLSSTAHNMGDVDCRDLHYESGARKYSAWAAYGQSKAANLLYAKSLAERLRPFGASAFSVHPGVIFTELWREQNSLQKALARVPLFPALNRLLPRLIADKSIEQGAATTLYACLAPGLEKTYPGAYFSDCDVGAVNPKLKDLDGRLKDDLWKTTERRIAAALE